MKTLLKPLKKALADLPAPSNLSMWWNWGSLLGVCLALQIATGLLLASHFVGSADTSFDRVIHIIRDVPGGWLIRLLHANGASLFFICLFLHVGRGLYYGSYFYVKTWRVGVILLLLTMGTAFLGYVLPWGQMSFWGASVITGLLRTVPYVGSDLVQWVWGGPSVRGATLTRFYALHYLLPFTILGLSGRHILLLHETGSSNPLGVNRDTEKIPFHPYYTAKDLVGFILVLALYLGVVLFFPIALSDPENFIPANSLVTPVHIQPEWYFLFAYAILRRVPNKLGGVLALAASVLILLLVPLLNRKNKIRSYAYSPLNQIIFWTFIGVFGLLTWIGACPVEDPFVPLGQVCSVLYFAYFFLAPALCKTWEIILFWECFSGVRKEHSSFSRNGY